jgi:hypothetical protein
MHLERAAPMTSVSRIVVTHDIVYTMLHMQAATTFYPKSLKQITVLEFQIKS